MTDEPAAAWDALACRSPRGEALQSVAWGEVKEASGWVARRYRIDDDAGPGGGRVDPGARPRRARRRAGRPPRSGAGAGRRAARWAGSCTRRSGPVLLRDDAGAVAAALRGLRRIARQRHAALLVIDPCWEVGPPRAGALLGRGIRARAAPGPGLHDRACSCRSTPTRTTQWRQLNQNARRNVEKCRKAGVEVVRFDRDDRPGRRWRGPSTRPTRCCSRRARGAASGTCCDRRRTTTPPSSGSSRRAHASLWVASHEGRELAHTLVHHSGDRAVLFEAGEADADDAADRADGRTAPRRFAANFLLQWTIIRWAAESGLRDLRHERRGQPRGARAARRRVASAVEPVPVQVPVGRPAGAVRGCLGVRAVAAAGRGAAGRVAAGDRVASGHRTGPA